MTEVNSHPGKGCAKGCARWAIILAVMPALVLYLLISAALAAQRGVASQYSSGPTASGERFSRGAMTAAHRTLPFGTRVRVTNHRTGRSVVVKINDRGPFIRGRVIDLTPAASRAIGMGYSLAPVTLEVVGRGG